MSRSIDAPAITSPSHDDIAARAYELYLEHGAQPGHDIDHWLEAERELTERTATAAAPEPAIGKPRAAKAGTSFAKTPTPASTGDVNTRSARS